MPARRRAPAPAAAVPAPRPPRSNAERAPSRPAPPAPAARSAARTARRSRAPAPAGPPATAPALAAGRPGPLPHPDPLGLLQRLALRLDRRREHHLGLLEVVDRLVAAGRRRRPGRAHQVERAVVLAGGPDHDLLQR